MPEDAVLDRPNPRWRSARFAALAVGLGALVGGLYAYFIGCKTGTCPLTSNVWSASAFGGLLGLVIGWPGRGRPPAT